MADAKTKLVLLAFIATLLVFASYKFLTTELGDPPVPCDQHRPYEIRRGGQLDLSSLSVVRVHLFGVRDVSMREFGVTEEQLFDLFIAKLEERLAVADESASFISFSITEDIGGHFHSRSYGRAERLISIGACVEADDDSDLCRRMTLPLYGANRNPLCDLDQAMQLFFSDQ